MNKVLRRLKPQSIEDAASRLTVEEFFSTRGVGQSTLGVWLDVLSYKNVDVEAWLNNNLSVSRMYNEARVRRKYRRK